MMAVPTVPMAVHTVYAVPGGNDFKDNPSSAELTIIATTVPTAGSGFEKTFSQFKSCCPCDFEQSRKY
jgi:hypothetical protein